MDRFSEKSLLSLGAFYVYGLIDPRNHQFFYIGKGTGNRVFEHEHESLDSPESEKLKLKTITEMPMPLGIRKYHNFDVCRLRAALFLLPILISYDTIILKRLAAITFTYHARRSFYDYE